MRKQTIRNRVLAAIEKGQHARFSPNDLAYFKNMFCAMDEDSKHIELQSARIGELRKEVSKHKFGELISLASGIIVGGGAVVLGMLLGAW